MMHATRRGFLRGSASLVSAAALSSIAPWQRAMAQAPTTLTVGRRTIEVKGRAASVFGILQPDGTSGLTIEPGEAFRVNLVNSSDQATLVHWHGQLPPYLQDGFPDRERPLIQPGGSQSYDFPATPGTHWMHSHQGMQEQLLLSAPLVVRTKEDVAADMQEVTVFLSDFTFTDPEEILASLTGGRGGMAMGSMAASPAPMAPPGRAAGGMPLMDVESDLNDVNYDAFLANDRTLDDPQVVQVERNGRVRLRIINGSASTAFWIELGALTWTIVAADGNPVEPLSGGHLSLSIAQRLDIVVDIPGEGAFPVLALPEGLTERTGIILATPGARIDKLAGSADVATPAVDVSLELQLRAVKPLAERRADLVVPMALTGSMADYIWSINGEIWPNVVRPVVRQGQRVVIEMENMTAMAHPMHLHGHAFQVLAVNGKELKGAMRDTVKVHPNESVRIAFDADNPGRWPLHCHNLYHMEAGMLTEIVYEGYA